MSVQNLMVAVEHVVQSWAAAKLDLEQSVALDDAWIHLIVGPVIFLLAALVMRKPVSSWRPWLVVLVLASTNEFVDLAMGSWPRLEHRYGDTVSDFLLTMSIPTLLLIIARRWTFARVRKNQGKPQRRSR